jgi:hypothetical protein
MHKGQVFSVRQIDSYSKLLNELPRTLVLEVYISRCKALLILVRNVDKWFEMTRTVNETCSFFRTAYCTGEFMFIYPCCKFAVEPLKFVSFYALKCVCGKSVKHNPFSAAVNRSVKQEFNHNETQRFNNLPLNHTQSRLVFLINFHIIFNNFFPLRLSQTWDVTELYAL